MSIYVGSINVLNNNDERVAIIGNTGGSTLLQANNYVDGQLLGVTGIAGPTGPSSGSNVQPFGADDFTVEGITGTIINPDLNTTIIKSSPEIIALPDGSNNGFIKTIVKATPPGYYTLGSGLAGGTNTCTALTYDNATDSLYVGGTFTSAGGVSAANIAMWQAGNTGGAGTWYSLGSGLSGGSTQCFALNYDNTTDSLYVGGTFTSAGGVSAANIAMWQPGNTGGTGTWYSLGSGLSNTCRALFYDNTRNYLYAGGAFITAGGTGASRIAMWQPGNTGGTGTWYSLGSGLNNLCYALAYDSTRNYLYTAGLFDTAGGVTRTNIAMWQSGNTGGTGTWYSLGSGVGGTIFALTYDSTRNYLYVGGSFTTSGNVSATNIAMWEAGNTGGTGTWYSLGSGLNGSCSSLTLDSVGNLYAGGGFITAGGLSVNSIAMWKPGNTGGTGTWRSLGSGLNFSCNGLAYDSTRNYIYPGGNFTTAGNVFASRVASIYTPNIASISGNFNTYNANNPSGLRQGEISLSSANANALLLWNNNAWNVLKQT
jgi:hypothetical protein